MGIKQILVDDFDGRDLPADTKPQTVTFDGTKYDVYMSARNTERFLDFLTGTAPLVGAGAVRTTPERTDNTERYGYTAKDVRDWAEESGHTIDGKTLSKRGKVSQAWYDAIKDAKGSK